MLQRHLVDILTTNDLTRTLCNKVASVKVDNLVPYCVFLRMLTEMKTSRKAPRACMNTYIGIASHINKIAMHNL